MKMKWLLLFLVCATNSLYPLMHIKALFSSKIVSKPVVHESLNAELWQALEKRDNAALKNLLSQKAIPNVNCFRNNTTPLIYACANDLHGIAQTLISAGADINKRDNKLGWTALMWATWMEHVKIIKLLYKANPDLNAQDRYGKTALMWAVNYNKIKIITFLAAAGADTTIKNSQSNSTAIEYASTENKDAIEKAIAAGKEQRHLYLLSLQKKLQKKNGNSISAVSKMITINE